MSRFRCFDFECPKCGGREESILFDLAEEAARWWCPSCGVEMDRLFGAPTVLQKSYPDGLRKKELQNQKEAAKLALKELDMQSKDDKQRSKAERRKLGDEVK